MSKKENLTKVHLSEALFNKIGYTKKFSSEIVNEFFSIVEETLINGNSIKIYGFGKFVLRDKNPRKGRNPITGKPIIISGRRVLVFQPSPILNRKFKVK